MAKHRGCTGQPDETACTFCTGPCPYVNRDEPDLQPVVKNGVMHLCDGSGEQFYATGEEPEELDDGDASFVTEADADVDEDEE